MGRARKDTSRTLPVKEILANVKRCKDGCWYHSDVLQRRRQTTSDGNKIRRPREKRKFTKGIVTSLSYLIFKHFYKRAPKGYIVMSCNPGRQCVNPYHMIDSAEFVQKQKN